MSIDELVESRGYKQFMQKLTGIGAAIVLLGAMFKIQHYPGAGAMLVVGLVTEALIFFFSAFEPLHEEIDWTLAYPELAGLDEIEEGMDNSIVSRRNKGGNAGGGGGYALERFDELLSKSNVGTELFDKLGEGLTNLSSTVANMSDITSATIATDKYAKSIDKAADSVNGLSDSFSTSSQAITKTSKIIGESGDSYQTLLEGLNSNFKSIGENGKVQAEQQELLSKNLTALNAVYELQLKSSSDNLNVTEGVATGMSKIMQDLKETSEDVAKYKEEVGKLSKNLASLNTVYGNMLAAMNVK
jgi:gliding motility-associated protein GldL